HYYYYRQAGALDQGSLVGTNEAIVGGFIKSFLQDVKAKALRSLRHHDAGARDGGFDERALGSSFHLFHGVDGGQSRDGGSMFMRGLDDTSDDFGRDQRANGIVHQNDIFGIGRGAGQCVGHGVLTMLSAFDHLQALAQDFRELLFDLGAKAGNLVLAQSNDDFVDSRSGGELTQGVDKNGHASQLFELLAGRLLPGFCGRGRRHARAQSGGGDDDKHLHTGDSV